MKIYVLEVDKLLQPDSQPICYPSFNDDYGVEQDFLKYLSIKKELIVNSPEKASWHYLPIFWTRWHLNHNYAQDGLEELRRLVDNVIIDPQRTFTVCQYDDGPVIKLNGVTVSLSSRNSNRGIDIPLLSKPHKIPWLKPKKTLTASFMGRLSTHPIRAEMKVALANHPEIEVIDGTTDVSTYVKKLLRSKIALCPRGYGGSSFRFYEAMQLGVIPFLVGDIDTRPFKKYLPWDSCSFYSNNVDDIMIQIEQKSDDELLAMGKLAQEIWRDELQYLKWEKYLIKHLEENKE